MYQAQQQGEDGKWVALHEPTVSFSEAQRVMHAHPGPVRVACVDNAAGAEL